MAQKGSQYRKHKYSLAHSRPQKKLQVRVTRDPPHKPKKKQDAAPVPRSDRTSRAPHGFLVRCLLIGLCIVLGLSFVVMLSLTVLFRVTRCSLDSGTRYSAATLEATLDLQRRPVNFFRVDKAELVRELHQALPWLRITRVTRRFPNRLHFSVAERSAVFAQETGGGVWLFDGGGRLLERADAPPNRVLWLRGAPLLNRTPGEDAAWVGSPLSIRQVMELLRNFRDTALWGHFTAVEITSNTLPVLVYQDRIKLQFSSTTLDGAQTLAAQCRTAARIIVEELNQRNPYDQGVLSLMNDGRGFFHPEWENAPVPTESPDTPDPE